MAPVPPLDVLAARAVSRARLLEQAVHDPGPWSITWAGLAAPARRVLDEAAGLVGFRAEFPGIGGSYCGTAALCCAGRALSWRDVEGLPGGFEVVWTLALAEPVAAA